MMMKSIFRHETILFLVVIVALVILSLQAEQFATIDNLINHGRLIFEGTPEELKSESSLDSWFNRQTMEAA